jgi:hypothetical protein
MTGDSERSEESQRPLGYAILVLPAYGELPAYKALT